MTVVVLCGPEGDARCRVVRFLGLLSTLLSQQDELGQGLKAQKDRVEAQVQERSLDGTLQIGWAGKGGSSGSSDRRHVVRRSEVAEEIRINQRTEGRKESAANHGDNY